LEKKKESRGGRRKDRSPTSLLPSTAKKDCLPDGLVGKDPAPFADKGKREKKKKTGRSSIHERRHSQATRRGLFQSRIREKKKEELSKARGEGLTSPPSLMARTLAVRRKKKKRKEKAYGRGQRSSFSSFFSNAGYRVSEAR